MVPVSVMATILSPKSRCQSTATINNHAQEDILYQTAATLENITPSYAEQHCKLFTFEELHLLRLVSHQPVPPSQREMLLYHSYVTLLFTYTLLCLLCESVEHSFLF